MNRRDFIKAGAAAIAACIAKATPMRAEIFSRGEVRPFVDAILDETELLAQFHRACISLAMRDGIGEQEMRRAWANHDSYLEKHDFVGPIHILEVGEILRLSKEQCPLIATAEAVSVEWGPDPALPHDWLQEVRADFTFRQSIAMNGCRGPEDKFFITPMDTLKITSTLRVSL